MIPVTQTKVVVKNSKGETVVRGNCFAAAVASIMELSINDVPNVEVFFHMYGSYWNEVMQTFINSKGWELCTDDRYKVFHPELQVHLRAPDGENYNKWLLGLRNELKDKHYLITGETVRGIRHITIWKNGVMVHDPHPTNEGLITLEEFQTLEKVN